MSLTLVFQGLNTETLQSLDFAEAGYAHPNLHEGPLKFYNGMHKLIIILNVYAYYHKIK